MCTRARASVSANSDARTNMHKVDSDNAYRDKAYKEKKKTKRTADIAVSKSHVFFFFFFCTGARNVDVCMYVANVRRRPREPCERRTLERPRGLLVIASVGFLQSSVGACARVKRLLPLRLQRKRDIAHVAE